MKSLLFLLLIASLLISCDQKPKNNRTEKKLPNETGSVVFIHPDGSGFGMWTAMRLLKVGPDGKTYWDKMDHIGLYRSHQTNSTNSSSHAGATVHAFGVKVPYNTYGNDPDRPFQSLSGKDYSIMTEAQKAGKSIAIINSGHICEPGTGVFVANSVDRDSTDIISYQIIHSGADIIFSGGEVLLLPEGKIGKHGKPGIRKDGRNLINEAMDMGYNVVYNKMELKDLPVNTNKVLGIFAAGHTFNDKPEEVLKEKELPMFNPEAPTIAEMTQKALEILTHKGKEFLMVVEEEGSDNFANDNNAIGAITALSRADDAIGLVMEYIEDHTNTLLITAADSDAGGMQVFNVRHQEDFDKPLPETQNNGSPNDGPEGTVSKPFIAKPDQNGDELRFGICWASDSDLAGGVVAKAHGLNSSRLPNNVDNTDIYRLMYLTLFGVEME